MSVLTTIRQQAVRLAEAGRLPDPLVRWGIRRLCRDRLRSATQGDCESRQQRLRRLLDDSRKGPVAPVPELANEQHYEVPAEFFSTVLGARRKYSCCYWGDGQKTLDEAEVAALELTAERAQLEDDQDVLELGCGWGSLTLWMAERYPSSRITAVSNSTSQRAFIEGAARERGLENVNVITTDVSELHFERARFDRVVSVEMFEHVRDHRTLLERISSWLRADGKLFIHIFCHRSETYTFENDSDSWMAQTFFSGGIMPSDDYLLRFQDHVRLTDQWRWSGRHYEKTANAWLRQLDQNRHHVTDILTETHGSADAALWVERWRLFFMACAELWGYRNGEEWWVSHYLFEPKPTSGAPT